MRVWLVDQKQNDGAGGLETLLRQLEAHPASPLRLLGASPFQPDFPAAMRKLVPDLLDLVVINEAAWPETAWTPEILDLGMGVVLVAAADRAERVRSLADLYPICVAPVAVDEDGLLLALQTALAAQRRQVYWKGQAAVLQQRLTDRIVIERAKGILVQRLGISEDDAYKRLRLLSRRQRRQIRDIAQSLLDTHGLLGPDAETSETGSGRAEAARNGKDSHDRGLLLPEL
jgi:two-component system, response regulator PdtaR